jgi:hypothetical protein
MDADLKKTAGIGRLALHGFCVFGFKPAMMREVKFGKEQFVVPVDFIGEGPACVGDPVNASAGFLPLIHAEGGEDTEDDHDWLDDEL